jgi:molybdopterin/thiamine biosynthesis adenylyltransferase
MYNDRFKDAPWYAGSMSEKIIIGGAGGIGSNALYFLTKTIPAEFYVFDDDFVSKHNVGTQFFKETDVGKAKTYSLGNNIKEFTGVFLQTVCAKIRDNILPIAIAGFDNMAARKEMFENWLKHESREIFIDGRLSANVYQIFVVLKGEREEWYKSTLFDDSVVDDGPCTFKQTAYVGGLIGARITHVLVNYLSNKYMGEDVFNIPYLIEENTEPFVIKICYNENI